jgi:capsule polysaccharide export protein KpsC/LpsZ
LLNISQQRGIECNVFEHTGFVGEFECKKVYYKNCLPQDVDYNTKLIYETWDKSDLSEQKKIEIANSFFDKKRIGISVDDKSYTKNQKPNLLPENVDLSKRIITIFNSSDDEYASLGKEWDYKLSKSRLTTLDAIFEYFKNKDDFHFYLRIHPNLANVKYKYVKDLEKLRKHSNLTIILPTSPINSYSLLDISEKIITFGSTIGVEAIYNKKPAILLNTCFTMGLNVYYMPKSHNELFLMIEENLKPKEILPVLKYAFHRISFGTKFTYFNPNPYKTNEFYIKEKLLVSFNKDYREAKYKGALPSLINFIKYKQASIPKNLMLKFNKNIIPK